MIRITVGNNLSRNSVIVEETTTLRKVLEDAGIDYTIGMTSLDGSTLAPGDLDKTFADFGITEKCYLLNVVKADNAAVVKICGGACVIESGATLKSLKLLKKFRPNALKLYDEKGGKKEEVFAVGLTNGSGTLNEFGVSFGSVANAEGKATVTLMIPEDVTDAKKWAEERIGVSILHLNKVEAGFADAIADVEREKAEVSAAISVM